MKIELEEVDNGFILTLFDESAPSETDKRFHVKTMKNAIKEVAEYHQRILAWRKSEEGEE